MAFDQRKRMHMAAGGAMNWNMIEGNWRLYQHELQRKWGRLTNEGLAGIAGNRQYLSQSLQKSYGISGSEAERQIRHFQDEVTNAPRYYPDRERNEPSL